LQCKWQNDQIQFDVISEIIQNQANARLTQRWNLARKIADVPIISPPWQNFFWTIASHKERKRTV
jgi:hypothetical protein